MARANESRIRTDRRRRIRASKTTNVNARRAAVGGTSGPAQRTSFGGVITWDRAKLTIERRGRKGRKEEQYLFAAFAAFAFQRVLTRIRLSETALG